MATGNWTIFFFTFRGYVLLWQWVWVDQDSVTSSHSDTFVDVFPDFSSSSVVRERSLWSTEILENRFNWLWYVACYLARWVKNLGVVGDEFNSSLFSCLSASSYSFIHVHEINLNLFSYDSHNKERALPLKPL